MPLWTALPQHLNVSYPDQTAAGESVTISVTDSDGEPIEDALVCISHSRLYGRGYTNSDGIAMFETTQAYPQHQSISILENASLVVTAQNYIPFEATISAEMELLGDINADGRVSVVDLVLLLLAWGDGVDDPADLNGDGSVNLHDLVIFLFNWK